MDNNVIQNRYKVIKHIGQGGMADVFVAIDTILNREVAIKLLRSELSSDPVSVLRFKREANASTSLSHPNIVDIYDIGEYKGHHYIVMEYIKGQTLKKLISNRGALCKEEAIDIMKQLVKATLEAHKRGIIHRDIKPQNVLVTSDGTVKMVDFGIALAQDALQLTQSDSIMGSVHYLAPELAKGEQASIQSDIYSLGIVFYELLVGDVPFKAEQAIQVALMHMRNDIPSIREVNPDIPQSIENIVIRATARNKNYRYKNAQEMLDHLKTCLDLDRINEKKSVIYYKEEVKKPIKEKEEKEVKKSKFNFAWVFVPLISLLLIAGVYFILSITGILNPKSKFVTVPDIIGMDITTAKETLKQNDLILDTENIEYRLTDNIPKGKIVEITPLTNDEVEKETKVKIVISSGIAAYIKDYTGVRLSDAKKEMMEYHNLNIIVQEEESESVASGIIIRQELLEPNSQFNPDISTDIRLVYSKYKTIEIPKEIQGMDVVEATKKLQDMGADVVLSLLDTSTMSDEEKANLTTGVVIQTSPAIGTNYTQEDGTSIVIYYY